MANPSIHLSVCRLWRACTLLRGFNFSGIFLHHIVAWQSGNSPTKNHEDRPRGSPPLTGWNRNRVVKQANLAYRRISTCLAISSPHEFLVFLSVMSLLVVSKSLHSSWNVLSLHSSSLTATFSCLRSTWWDGVKEYVTEVHLEVWLIDWPAVWGPASSVGTGQQCGCVVTSSG